MDAVPSVLRQDATRRQLEIHWPDGQRATLSYRRLREACRCADCTQARRSGTAPATSDAVDLVRILPMGHYAVQLVFSDGHARGIFPWRYLKALVEPPGM